MGLLILQETPLGYALLKAKSSKILNSDGFSGQDESAERICSLLKLRDFQKFDSAATALEQSAALVEGKVTPQLASLLDSIKDEKKASLAVADPKLANAINKLPQLSLKLVSDSTTTDLYRSIRNHLPSLIPGLLPEDVSTMSLGLSHSLSRHKLKFSPDKVDTMIIQAISLLDDLDKELNIYAMRVKEWYGWHFPEMARIINDNLAYSRVILKMGLRTGAANADLSEILPEEIEVAVKSAAEISMGTEISAEDLENVQELAEQVISFTEYRSQLSSYLSARMAAIAPNLTTLVGDLVGARLIAHAGSLMNLAKSPASTIQILGAEKALFRALKTKHDTPKYGLIYHASLVGQATGKNKGKIARVLAAKSALALRVDALQEEDDKGDPRTEEEKSALGTASRLKIERRLAGLEGKPLRSRGVAIGPNGVSVNPGKWEVKEARKYNPDADGLAGDEPAAATAGIKKKSGKHRKHDAKVDQRSENTIPQMAGQQESHVNQHVDKNTNSVGKRQDQDRMDSDDVVEDVKESQIKKDRKRHKDSRVKATDPAPDRNGANVDADQHVMIEGNDKPPVPLSTNSSKQERSSRPPTHPKAVEQPVSPGEPSALKRARKKDRHEKKSSAPEQHNDNQISRDEKLSRKLDHKGKQAKRAEQGQQTKEEAQIPVEDLADLAGLSIKRYERKLARGEIVFDQSGKPTAISKKVIKKARKAAEKAEKKAKKQLDTGKKRKRDSEEVGVEETLKKKRSKKGYSLDS